MIYLKQIFIVIAILLGHWSFSQDTSDVYRLKNLEYMEFQDRVDCQNQEGTNLDIRICLNLEFQEKDSILNTVLENYFVDCESEKACKIQTDFHKDWLNYRRDLSEANSEGHSGHFLGIVYLHTMILVTDKRIEELLLLQRED